MRWQTLRNTLRPLGRPALALALVAGVAAGLVIGPNLSVSSTRLPHSVRLRTEAAGQGTPSTSSGGPLSSPAASLPTTTPQPTEPVETVTPPPTVVSIPNQDSTTKEQPQGSPCTPAPGGDSSCSSGGG